MSPAVNVTLEEVPFAILEAVKARILANRRRLDERKQRPSTRPRPQFRSVGASSKEWRPPQPVAGVIPEKVVVGGYFIDRISSGVLIRTLDKSVEYLAEYAKSSQPDFPGSKYTVIDNPIVTGVHPNLGIGVALFRTGSNTRVYNSRNEIDYAEGIREHMVFPAGGKNIIICFYSKIYSSKSVITARMTYSYQTFYDGTYDDNPYDFDYYRTNHQISSEVSGSAFGPFIDEKFEAILVTDKTIKSINVPSKIIDIFKETTPSVVIRNTSGGFYPASEVIEGTFGNQTGIITGAVTDSGNRYTRSIPSSASENNYTLFGPSPLPLRYFYNGRIDANVGGPDKFYIRDYTMEGYRHPSIGFQQVGTYFWWRDDPLQKVGVVQDRITLPGQLFDLRSNTYTPAIFTTLERRSFANDNLTNLQMINTYLSGVPRPKYTIKQVIAIPETASSFDDIKVRFDLTRDVDVTVNSKFIKNDDPPTAYSSQRLDAEYVYDWAQPAYCRQKLLELGFSPEDLRP